VIGAIGWERGGMEKGDERRVSYKDGVGWVVSEEQEGGG